MLAENNANCPKIELARWYQGKSAAISVTLDDWTPGQIEIGAKLLRDRGVPATFYVTLANMYMSPCYDHWAKLQELLDSGNEIGNHTVNHKDLTLLSDSECMREIYEAKKIIDSHLRNGAVETFAYPFGKYNDAVMEKVMFGHIGARGYRSDSTLQRQAAPEQMAGRLDAFAYGFAQREKDYFALEQLSFSRQMNLTGVRKVFSEISKSDKFVPLVFHGIYNDVNDRDMGMHEALHETEFDAILRELNAVRDDVWITTFSNAIKYHRAISETSIQLRWCEHYGESGSRYEFFMKSADPFAVSRRHPLTIKLDVGQRRRCRLVTQSEKAIEHRQQAGIVQCDVEPVDSIVAVQVENVSS